MGIQEATVSVRDTFLRGKRKFNELARAFLSKVEHCRGCHIARTVGADVSAWEGIRVIRQTREVGNAMAETTKA